MISNLSEFHEYCLQANVKSRPQDLTLQWECEVSGIKAYELGIRDMINEIREDTNISSEIAQDELERFLYEHCS